MRILITGGGTKVGIDPVRSITNMSSGRFAADIATEALDMGHEVTYLVAKDAQTPFLHKIDFNKLYDIKKVIEKINAHHLFVERHYQRYSEYIFKEFEDYASRLEYLVKHTAPDVVILAAAVSDYITDYNDSKIRSSNQLELKMRPLPKLISLIKSWAPNTILIGFKLMVGATDDQMIETARKSIQDNACDLVVANDLTSIKKGQHRIIVVDSNNHSIYGPETDCRNGRELGEKILAHVAQHYENQKVDSFHQNSIEKLKEGKS